MGSATARRDSKKQHSWSVVTAERVVAPATSISTSWKLCLVNKVWKNIGFVFIWKYRTTALLCPTAPQFQKCTPLCVIESVCVTTILYIWSVCMSQDFWRSWTQKWFVMMTYQKVSCFVYKIATFCLKSHSHRKYACDFQIDVVKNLDVFSVGYDLG